jgi:hypothetical protein
MHGKVQSGNSGATYLPGVVGVHAGGGGPAFLVALLKRYSAAIDTTAPPAYTFHRDSIARPYQPRTPAAPLR